MSDTRLMQRKQYYCMNEAEVRNALHDSVITALFYEDPVTRVVDEFVVEQGRSRVDVAAINGQIHGFEIKSANDTLDRLDEQQKSYNKVFDRITLVVDERHVEQAMKIIPTFWGLISVSQQSGRPVLNQIWPARQNFQVDAYALCQLLWRDEVITLLENNKLARRIRSLPRKRLWRILATAMPLPRLQQEVRRVLKFRKNWR